MQDGETQEQMLKVLQCQTFKNCGITTESDKLLQRQDAKDENENDAAEIPPLTELAEAMRQGEWWSGQWLRIFTGGGVADPDDDRIATGGCGIDFGKDHPLNTANLVQGGKLDCYRDELQAVRMTLSGCKKWETKVWIKLDNSAVVGDINKRITNQGQIHKQDNNDMWDALNPLIAERAKKGKGHATNEHIASGKTSHEEKAGNIEADKLATAGIAMNNVDGTMVKADRQRKSVTALQQTKLVKMWFNRQELAALDQAE